MASLKSVKNKIVGVQKTKQITKAMYMVASAKLCGAQGRIERFRPFAEKFQSMLTDLAGKTDATAHPLLEERAEKKTCGIILVTSDRGLCGGFNANLISAAVKLARAKKAEGMEVKFYNVGRKGREAIRKLGFEQPEMAQSTLDPLTFVLAGKLGEDIIGDYLAGKLDEVHMVFAEFISMARQLVQAQPILPIAAPKVEEQTGGAAESQEVEYIYEPDVVTLLAVLLPRYIKAQIYRGLLDTSASEQAARMTAMDNATRNCDEIAASLTLLYNKTRQSAITTDLIDIVSGANALNGQ